MKICKFHRILTIPALCAAALLVVPITGSATESSEQQCSRVEFSACLNGVSSSVTNGPGLRVSSSELDEVARERSGSSSASASGGTASLFKRETTLAAGDEMGGSVFGMWVNYSYSDFDSDFAFRGTSLAYDGDAHNVTAGIDRLFGGRFLIGVAGGYQFMDTDTDFNGGGQENDGFTIAPYAAVLINDYFSIDVMGGYSSLEYDQDRISPTDGTDIRADFDADRWFVATNFNALYTVSNWVFGGRIGYLHTDEEQDDYLETGSAASAAAGRLRTVQERNIDLSQMIVSADVGYTFGNFEPYVMAAFHEDVGRNDDNGAGGLPGNFTSVQPDDDDEWQFNVGIRHYTDWGATMSFEYSRVEGRQAFDSDTFMFTVRAAL